MTRTVQIRATADRDITQAVAYLASEASPKIARDFVLALERALRTLGEQPAIGSPRFGEILDVEGLRTWPLGRFPYLAFYRFDDVHVDLWRVLHTRRDIAASFKKGSGG